MAKFTITTRIVKGEIVHYFKNKPIPKTLVKSIVQLKVKMS